MTMYVCKAPWIAANARYLPPSSTMGPEAISCGAVAKSNGLIPSIAGSTRKVAKAESGSPKSPQPRTEPC